MLLAFRRSDVIVAVYPTHDEAGHRYMLLKGTPGKLEKKVEQAEQRMGPFRILRPTWVALMVENSDVARATRDVYELHQYERAGRGKAGKATIEFCEQLTPRGRDRFSQTNIVERYTRYIRSGGLTLRKIRLARDPA
jgi:hypothetical protein